MNISQIAPPEPFKALIFDCDGTLADTMPAHARSWAATYKAFGIEIAEQPFLDMGGLPNRAIIEKLNQEHGYTLEVGQTQEEKERRYLETLHSIAEITAVAGIARTYRSRVPMAVASSRPGRMVRQTLTTTGLLPCSAGTISLAISFWTNTKTWASVSRKTCPLSATTDCPGPPEQLTGLPPCLLA